MFTWMFIIIMMLIYMLILMKMSTQMFITEIMVTYICSSWYEDDHFHHHHIDNFHCQNHDMYVHHLVNPAHELNIQWLQSMSCGGDEVQAGMYSSVWNLKFQMLGIQKVISDRDAKNSRYGRYICAILSKAVLIFGPCTVRNRNREHCAVRSVLLTLWP